MATADTSTKKLRVVLIDDHALVREGLRALLEQNAGAEVVGQASDGREGVRLIDELKPEIVIMDIGMPNLNGIDATRQIMRDHPETSVIALSMHTDKRFVLAMFEAGAKAYVAKDSIYDEIVRAIQAVGRGRKYISSDVAGPVLDSLTAKEPDLQKASALGVIGPREREVLQLLAEGYTSAEIAKQLAISVHTVDTHRRNIMKKTETHSIAELTKLAIREGLTSA